MTQRTNKFLLRTHDFPNAAAAATARYRLLRAFVSRSVCCVSARAPQNFEYERVGNETIAPIVYVYFRFLSWRTWIPRSHPRNETEIPRLFSWLSDVCTTNRPIDWSIPARPIDKLSLRFTSCFGINVRVVKCRKSWFNSTAGKNADWRPARE